MHAGHLRELEEIFKHHGDALILVGLSLGLAAAQGRPLRFSEVARAIIKHTGSYMGEGSLTGALPRMERSGLVAVYGRPQRRLYGLTSLGQERADLLISVLETLNIRDNPQ